MLIVFRGLPGVGKTFLVTRLVERRPELLVLSRDSLRSSLISKPTYGEEEKTLVDDLIVVMARHLLQQGRSVVVDGMALSLNRKLEEFAAAAASQRKGLCVIECICREGTALARIRESARAHPAGDRTDALYRQVKERFEQSDYPFLRIDTEEDPDENVRAILGYIENPPT